MREVKLRARKRESKKRDGGGTREVKERSKGMIWRREECGGKEKEGARKAGRVEVERTSVHSRRKKCSRSA